MWRGSLSGRYFQREKSFQWHQKCLYLLYTRSYSSAAPTELLHSTLCSLYMETNCWSIISISLMPSCSSSICYISNQLHLFRFMKMCVLLFCFICWPTIHRSEHYRPNNILPVSNPSFNPIRALLKSIWKKNCRICFPRRACSPAKSIFSRNEWAVNWLHTPFNCIYNNNNNNNRPYLINFHFRHWSIFHE